MCQPHPCNLYGSDFNRCEWDWVSYYLLAPSKSLIKVIDTKYSVYYITLFLQNHQSVNKPSAERRLVTLTCDSNFSADTVIFARGCWGGNHDTCNHQIITSRSHTSGFAIHIHVVSIPVSESVMLAKLSIQAMVTFNMSTNSLLLPWLCECSKPMQCAN